MGRQAVPFRECGFPFRRNVNGHFYWVRNSAELDALLKEHEGRRPCYISAFSYTKAVKENKARYTSAIIDKLPFDFDFNYQDRQTLADCQHDLQALMDYILDKFDAEPRIIYTTNRGFNVFIDFEEIVIPDQYKARCLKEVSKSISEAARFRTVDAKLHGDLARLLGIPNTRHHKTMLYRRCIELNTAINADETVLKKICRRPTDAPINLLDYQKKNVNFREFLMEYWSQYIEAEEARMRYIRTRRNGFKFRAPEIWENKEYFKAPCFAIKDLLENGAREGTRDYAICGLVRYLKHRQFQQEARSVELMVDFFNEWLEKCSGPKDLNVRSIVEKQYYKPNYAPCHMIQHTGKCRTPDGMVCINMVKYNYERDDEVTGIVNEDGTVREVKEGAKNKEDGKDDTGGAVTDNTADK